MADEHSKRRNRLVPDNEVIERAEAGTAPDVQVFALDDHDTSEQLAPPRPQPTPPRQLEEASTTEWSTRDLQAQVPATQRRSKQVAGSIEGQDSAALIWTGGAPPPEDPIETRPTNPTGTPLLEAQLTDPIIEQDSPPGEEQPEPAHRPLLEAPLQIQIQAVDRISPDPALRLITASSSEAAEQYRVLALKLKEGRSIRRVVAVTAPTTESGGPILAANLALALAEGRRTRIALVDADLRAGRLAELFDLVQGPGLGEQLRNHRRQPEQPWILLSLTESLHLIPAGRAEKNPSSLLNSEVLGDLLAELRRSHDFIILSTPPVTESADANILQEHVDGALLVVRAAVTTKDVVRASITRLGERKFIGAVLCGV